MDKKEAGSSKDSYDIKESEKKWMSFWEKEKIYSFDEKSKKPAFSVDTPPPTVSGKMHIGHAFSYSQQDFMIRFKRMSGFNVFYPFGTDDNGLPTERLVEKSKKVKAKDMPREEFIKLCTQFLKEELPKFVQDWKNIGISADFDVYYSTINDHCRRVSQWSFLDLHKKGRMERRDAPAMWCPECRTGVSQVEIKDKEFETNFNDIVFKVKEGKKEKELIIATTRPELLPACVAVFAHPTDDRYKKLFGKKARVPLFDFEVPIMSDERADPSKGTGIVMCCTFGDQTDMEWQKAHKLEIKEAIDKEGKLTDICGRYKGMAIKEARKAIIEDLKKASLLIKQERIKHFVNVHERCDTEIEFVKTKQWFVRYLDLKKDMLKWGAELKWHPAFMKARYDNWVKGLQWDWLISNQRHFGVPFPVWYCKKCGEVLLADEKQLPVDPLKDKPIKKCKCGNSSDIEPEKDILNTWFTSSMTPRLAVELMDADIQKKIFPMSLRPQAHDIITFWLFNTVFKSNIHFGKNPWSDVMISGFVTLEGQKMSKSKGNTIEPQIILEKYGADALRYWASSSKLGEDLDYQEKEILTGIKFINKIFNASKFAFMNMGDKYKPKTPGKILESDRLFIVQLNNMIKNATDSFEDYNYAQAKMSTDRFFWMTLCDNYLEIIKNRMYNGTKEEKESASYALYNALLAVIKMMAPITPFITEELYQKHFRENEGDKSVHISSWPEKVKIAEQKDDDKKWQKMIEIIEKTRRAKSEAKKSMKAEIILTLSKEDKKLVDECISDLKAVCNAKDLKEGKELSITVL